METKLLLVDDHSMFRQGLRLILEKEEDLTIVGECSSGPEALGKVGVLQPHIVVLDIFMPGLNGFAVARRLRQSYPEIGLIILTLQSNEVCVEEARKIGVHGYVIKAGQPGDLIEAIRQVRAGGTWFFRRENGEATGED